MKRLLAYLFIVLGFGLTSSVNANSNKPIIIPTHNWSSQIVGAYVIGGIFESIGKNIKYKNHDSQAVYESIRRGDVSISHEVWESAFGRSFNNALSKGGIIDAGLHPAPTMEDIGVPTWVIEKNLCPGLPNWEALKNCADVFARPGSKGKGIILEGPQSWHGDLIPQRIDALGLGKKYKVKFAVSADQLWRELYDAKKKGKGILMFNWSPNFTDAEGFTMIKWPKYYAGCRPDDGGSGACGSPAGYLKKAASSKFANQHPDAFNVFKKILFTTKDMGKMAYYVDVEKMTHQDAAKKWLRKNKYKWEYWIGRTNIAYNAFDQQKIEQDSFYETTTKIAKAEPSQTQKVASKVKANENFKLTKNEVDSLFSSVGNCWSLPLGLPYNKDLSIKIKVNLDQTGSVIRTEILDHSKINKKGNGYLKVLAESALRAIKLCSPLKVPNGKYPLWQQIVFNFDANEVLNGIESEDTKIAKNNLLNKHIELGFNVKKEQTTKPKKKVKVAKAEEPKQEEFKPENKDIDNDAPIIEIAQNIIVDSQTYTLKGKVKDESQIYLTIDGRQVEVKKGKFELPGFIIDPSEEETLKIVAIDRWQNKSEKTINIKVKFKQTADARSYEKPNPNNIRTKKDNDKIGIIIGIEKYQALNNLDAPYANRDANAFRAYATRALGIPNKNLKVLIDEEATRSGLLKSLKIWLPQMTRGKSKDIYIFFAGHGLASDDGKDLHILPQDGDPILLEDTALSRVEMFDLINKVSPKSVTMFFDTCYSGQTRSEQMLIAGLRPVRIVADEQDTPNNFTIFTASNYDQTSGSINEAEHGIFSYYLMKGLEGNADANEDKKLTNGELIAYLKNNVSQEAFTQNRTQEPMFAGDPDKVLISYR